MTIHFNRLSSLFSKSLKNIAYLIRERMNMIEVKILVIGLFLMALTWIYLLYLLFTDFHLYRVLSSTAIIHLMGGRALGIVTCLSADISLFYTILYNDYMGFGYLAYIAVIFGFLLDITFNGAKVTTQIINGIANAIGSAFSVVPC